MLTAAGGSRWSRPDLTATFGRLAAEQARDDATWAVAAGWTLHGRAAIGDARDEAAAVLAQLGSGARRDAARGADGARLRAELAGVARDHGSADVAKRLLDGLLRNPATPVDVRFDALVARARASLSDGPDRLEQLLSPIDAAALEVAGNAAAATAELLRSAAERAQSRHHTAADRARTAMALLGWRPQRPTAETESDHLTAALATQWIGALLDAGALREARAAADEIAPRLEADGLASRQRAQLRLTCARATSRPSGTIDALERAATDAGAAGAPDLESACRAALAELHDASGRSVSAREQLRLRRRAEDDDRRRADLFRVATPQLAGLVDDTATPAADGKRRGVDRQARTHTSPGRSRIQVTGARGTRDVLSGTALDSAVPVAHDPFVGTPLAPDPPLVEPTALRAAEFGGPRPGADAPEQRPTPPSGTGLGPVDGRARPSGRATPPRGTAAAPTNGAARRNGRPVTPADGPPADAEQGGSRRSGRAASSYMSSPMGDALLAELRSNGSVTDSAWEGRDEASRFRSWNAEVAGAAEQARARQSAAERAAAERAAAERAAAERAAAERAAAERAAAEENAARLAGHGNPAAVVEEPVTPALAVTDTAAAAAEWLARAIAEIDDVWGRPESPPASRHRAPEGPGVAPDRNGATTDAPSGRRRRRSVDDAGTATDVAAGRTAGARFRSATETSVLRAVARGHGDGDHLGSVPTTRPQQAVPRVGRRARREAAERGRPTGPRTDGERDEHEQARPGPGGPGAAVSVVVDLVSGDQRVGGAAVAVALQRIARRAGAILPPGASLRGCEDAVTVEFPGLDRAGAAAWVHSVLEDLAAGLPTARDLDGAFLRAAVVGADGVRGAQILHDLGTSAAAGAVSGTGGTAVERVAAARAARRITSRPPAAGPDLAGADLARPHTGGPDAGADLERSDLGRADVADVDLAGADLRPPDIGGPDAASSDIAASDPAAPDSQRSDLAGSGLAGSDLASPDLGGADVASPDVASPDVASPDVASPDVASPDLASPDLASPDLRGADLGGAGVADVYLAGAGLGHPDLRRSGLGPPELGPPELGPPELGPPELGPPELGLPGLGRSDAAGPDVGGSDVVRPDVAGTETAGPGEQTRGDLVRPLPVVNPDVPLASRPQPRGEPGPGGGRHRERAVGNAEAAERGGRHRGRRLDDDAAPGAFASTQDPPPGGADTVATEEPPTPGTGRRRRRYPADVTPPATPAPDVVDGHVTEPHTPPGAEPLPRADAAAAAQEEPDIESLGLADLLAGAMAAYRGM
ncbi:hypothetical protein [Pseudonocardia sp.]|uniref:hypothetical protein n=1 Tax=Pseudonocardia sp. TaxID=60912 RepID=UPI003D0ED14B